MSYVRYKPYTYLVCFPICCAWTGMRCRTQQCAQPHSAPKICCLVQTLYFPFQTLTRFSKLSLRNTRVWCTEMEFNTTAACLWHMSFLWQPYAWYIYVCGICHFVIYQTYCCHMPFLILTQSKYIFGICHFLFNHMPSICLSYAFLILT